MQGLKKEMEIDEGVQNQKQELRVKDEGENGGFPQNSESEHLNMKNTQAKFQNKSLMLEESPFRQGLEEEFNQYSSKESYSQELPQNSYNQFNDYQKHQPLSDEEQYPQISSQQLIGRVSVPSKKQSIIEDQEDGHRKSMIINLQDTEDIPSVELLVSSPIKKPIKVKILMYNVSTFLKVETQTYIIDVVDPNTKEEYQIKRRFSQFISFYQSLIYNNVGYILCPFPQSNASSFMKIKLGMGTSFEGEKHQLIEKRMIQLEKFVNYVSAHKQLSNSQELAIFLEKDHSQYEKGQTRLSEYVEEYKNLQSEWNIRSLTSKLFAADSKTHNQNISSRIHEVSQLGNIEQGLSTLKLKHEQLLKNVNRLYESEKKFGQFSQIQTDIDALLKMSAKNSSGRQYSMSFAYYLNSNIIDNLHYNIKWIEEVERVLSHHRQLIRVGSSVKKTGQNEKYLKIERRVKKLEKTLTNEWQSFNKELELNYREITKNLFEECKSYRKKMCKIWRKPG